MGFYNEGEKKYYEISLDYPQEIVSGIGNISLNDNEIFAHIHVSLSDEKGNLKGGHLMIGTKVFACEYMIIPTKGLSLERKYDDITGLFLLK